MRDLPKQALEGFDCGNSEGTIKYLGVSRKCNQVHDHLVTWNKVQVGKEYY